MNKNRNAVSRMKRVVKGRHWWYDYEKLCYYQLNAFNVFKTVKSLTASGHK